MDKKGQDSSEETKTAGQHEAEAVITPDGNPNDRVEAVPDFDSQNDEPDKQPEVVNPQARPASSPEPSQPTPAEQPKKGLSLGWILGIVGGAVSLLVLTAGVIVLALYLSGPSQEDYEQARDVVSSVRDDYDKTVIPFRSFDESDLRSASRDAENLEEKLAKYSDNHQQFDGLKALKRDEDVREAYNAYHDKASKYIEFNKNVLHDAPMANDMSEVCEEANRTADYSDAKSPSQVLSMYDAHFKKCAQSIDSAKDSFRDETFKDWVDELSNLLVNSRKTLGEAIRAIEKKDANTYNNANATLGKLSQDHKRAVERLEQEYQDRLDSIKPASELSDLIDVLDERLAAKGK